MKKAVIIGAILVLLSSFGITLFAAEVDPYWAQNDNDLVAGQKLYSPEIQQTDSDTDAWLFMNDPSSSGNGQTEAMIEDNFGDTNSCTQSGTLNYDGDYVHCHGGPNNGETTYAVGWYSSISSGSPINSSSRIE